MKTSKIAETSRYWLLTPLLFALIVFLAFSSACGSKVDTGISTETVDKSEEIAVMTGGFSENAPSIAVDLSNNVHIVYANSIPELEGIYYKKLDNSGKALTSDIRATSNRVFDVSTAIDSNGNVHIAWQGELNSILGIYYKKLDNDGNGLTSEIKIASSTNRITPPSIAVDSSGDIHIVWWDDRNEKSFKPGQVNWEIYYKKLCNDGSALTDDVRITNAKLGSFYPSIAVDTNNNVHVAWYDSRYENSDDWQKCRIYYRKLSP